MAESELIITFMLSLSLILVIISTVRRYTINFILPGVTILMLLGANVAISSLLLGSKQKNSIISLKKYLK